MTQLGDGGEFLGPVVEFSVKGTNEYPLYAFFRIRVAKKDEWDEEAYLTLHPEVQEAIQKKEWMDGLHEFIMEGFNKGKKGKLVGARWTAWTAALHSSVL